jgi:asparagine synthase (glutamine-hydrolysing)
VCGIAGLVHPDPFRPVAHATLSRMARAIRHRGPDGYGIATDGGAGLVSTRLAIIDIEAGWQPMRTPTSAIVFNGEVYNHTELRAGLGDRVRDWRTDCDTEVILRLLDLDGLAALDHLNGQFAIAWWQPGSRRLTLIRDRFGVRPLYYSVLPDGSLVFGSEAKCLFASGLVRAEPDREGIDEVFHLWGARAPRTPFAGVRQVRPGGIVAWEDGRIVADTTWWTPEVDRPGRGDTDLEELLRDSVRLRLRADVTVGTYLSGGLDSSLITALAVEEAGEPVETFSVAFADAEFDERVHQREVAHVQRARWTCATTSSRSTTPTSRAPSSTRSGTPRPRRCAPRRSRSACWQGRCGRPGSWWSPRARARTRCSGATTSSRRPRSAGSPCASRARAPAPPCSTGSTPTWGAGWRGRPSGGAP